MQNNRLFILYLQNNQKSSLVIGCYSVQFLTFIGSLTRALNSQQNVQLLQRFAKLLCRNLENTYLPQPTTDIWKTLGKVLEIHENFPIALAVSMASTLLLSAQIKLDLIIDAI
jgi:hypothetical protein